MSDATGPEPSAEASSFALEVAVDAGDTAAVKALLDGGADPNARCHDIETPVVAIALRKGNVEMVRTFCEHGADLAAVSPDPLIAAHAWASDNDGILGLLLELGYDPNARDSRGWTALHHVAALGYRRNVALLLKAGADRVARTPHGLTPADLARNNGHNDLADQLQAP